MISGFLSGLVKGFADYTHDERTKQRAREDEEIAHRKAILDSIFKGVASGDVDPRVFGQALRDSMALGEAQASPRKRSKGSAGFFGATDSPITPFLDQLMAGEIDLGTEQASPGFARAGMSSPMAGLPPMPAFALRDTTPRRVTLPSADIFISPEAKAKRLASARASAETDATIDEARRIAAFMQTPEFAALPAEQKDALQRKLTGYQEPKASALQWRVVPDSASSTGWSQVAFQHGVEVQRVAGAQPYNNRVMLGAEGQPVFADPRRNAVVAEGEAGTLHLPPLPQPNTQFLPTPQGYFAVDGKSGQALGYVLDERGLPVLPNRQQQDLLSAGQETELSDIDTLLSQITDATTKGFAARWGGVGGFWRGSLHQWLRGQFGVGSPAEADLRTSINNIFSTIAKLRGGTALTAQEKKILESYVPTINEQPEGIQDKLRGLQAFLRQKRQSLLDAARGSRQQGGTSRLPAPPPGAVDPAGAGASPITDDDLDAAFAALEPKFRAKDYGIHSVRVGNQIIEIRIDATGMRRVK